MKPARNGGLKSVASADNPVITPHSYEEAFVPPRISYCMFIDGHIQSVNNLISMFFNNYLDAILNKVILFYNFAESTFCEILCKPLSLYFCLRNNAFTICL